MPITFVQKTPTGLIPNEANSSSITSSAFGSSTSNGNLIAIVVWKDSSTVGTVSSVTLSAGGTPVLAKSQAFQGSLIEIHYVQNITGAANVTATVNYSAVVNGGIAALEYSGIATSGALDVVNSGSGTSTAPSSGSVTPAGTSLYLGAMDFGTGAASVTSETGWTERYKDPNGTNMQGGVEDNITSGAQTATWALASSLDWVAAIATFKVAGAGASVVSPRCLSLLGVGS